LKQLGESEIAWLERNSTAGVKK